MNKYANQELLPPAAEGPTSPAGWLDWLLDPLPGRLVLPATGLLIMVLDWLLFSNEAITLGLATPIAALVGFLAGGLGTYHLQRHYGRDPNWKAWLKGLAAGCLVGVPFPVVGTVVGGWILAISGLTVAKDRLLKEGLKRR